jgi:hypothetical protein
LSGEERPRQANFVFRELGFTVEKIGETRPDPLERRDLTAAEVSLIVADDDVPDVGHVLTLRGTRAGVGAAGRRQRDEQHRGCAPR